mmetsp:Transcript_17860/g.30632  ORF Transcript_17860/g.30632 Transcript_17860/m.30632 type:complete len:406 (+) Transcript_17860:89-1306(+)|eukprot:CAMPEP_0119101402 /NCGR_PEP_ID=MMETSP1180-20130426/461_1 /TAXON_ID=3052 ORGANISM="Chlamydomonas cf sp, Strain CCMP681" /NCGR_SAMPLE_ID=MMETSP1180 /ASSEMBLY_ACC=CAM_ASM_000741 /LENGTH=405 /DNA_ID=CAMNT_0007085519 /DNA_START=89 /DNA_END=1306 /DNA_ORIENTATION=+
MAHDGSYEVEWKGVAFPFLMHHPNSFLKTENYGSAKGHSSQPHGEHSNQRGGSDTQTSAGTGTWNGAAPQGYMRNGVNTAAPAVPVAVREQEFANLVTTGQKIPLLAMGTYRVCTPDIISKALELGYRHFDCAAGYENEAVVGNGLRPFIDAGHRSELFITSKLFMENFQPERVRAACEKSIVDLGCTYLDLYVMHFPEAVVPGSNSIATIGSKVEVDTSITPLDTWRALEQLVDAGLVRSLGVANFSLKQVEDLLAGARIKPVVNQVELQPFLPQRKLLGVCFRKGVQCMALSPLHELGSPEQSQQEELLEHLVVIKIAEAVGKSPAQVLLRWSLQRGVPTVVGGGSEAVLKELVEGTFTWHLNNEHQGMLAELESGKRFYSPVWKTWADPEEGGAAKASLVLA